MCEAVNGYFAPPEAVDEIMVFQTSQGKLAGAERIAGKEVVAADGFLCKISYQRYREVQLQRIC